ncbi:hypothetical protein E2C01_074852 [Portunus trituberculatus]|uniref:Uncharacterized protein n=1 Tax=Portunus trituberculatus TaxID=210409 RepID=A0A5B7IHC4_PORTR|nr:hypothetical protein [Portunus trituberculatus]
MMTHHPTQTGRSLHAKVRRGGDSHPWRGGVGVASRERCMQGDTSYKFWKRFKKNIEDTQDFAGLHYDNHEIITPASNILFVQRRITFSSSA